MSPTGERGPHVHLGVKRLGVYPRTEACHRVKGRVSSGADCPQPTYLHVWDTKGVRGVESCVGTEGPHTSYRDVGRSHPVRPPRAFSSVSGRYNPSEDPRLTICGWPTTSNTLPGKDGSRRVTPRVPFYVSLRGLVN